MRKLPGMVTTVAFAFGSVPCTIVPLNAACSATIRRDIVKLQKMCLLELGCKEIVEGTWRIGRR